MGTRAYCAITLALGALITALTLPNSPFGQRLINPPRDVALDGVPAPNTDLGPWLERRARALADRTLTVRVGQDELSTTLARVGISLDTARAARLLDSAASNAQPLKRLRRAFGPPLHLTNVAPPLTFDEGAALRWLTQLAPRVRRPAANARLDVQRKRRFPAQLGHELDVSEAVTVLREFVERTPPSLELPMRELAPSVTLRDLPPIDVSRVLAVYETEFRKKAGARALNIRRAAELLDGAIIHPGDVLSFNQVVGKRELSRGFVNAPVIIEDEMEPGVGGGVCQVATTLHAAAVFGNLQVVERRSHSRPSGYAPLGLDATVIDGKVDLRLRNPFAAPIMIHATLPSSFKIRVEILGASPAGEVEHSYAVTQRHDFYRRIVQKADLAPGQFERTQKGGFGYDTVSHVKLARPDGTVERRHYQSKYYPVPEVYWVGPQTRLDELPPLPDGASHVEM